MYKPPLFRRILPWIYALVFVIVAPMLLFYTAGYRYNLKKRLVERNGALIVDGTPKDAIIFLDGADTGKTTPYTFQHVTPGWHTVHVEKQGYNPWEKRLDIRPEEVTFVNDIHLWSTKPVTLVSSDIFTRLETDPHDTVFAVLKTQDDMIRSGVWNPRTQTYQLSPIATSTVPTRVPLRWNTEGTSFVLNGITADQPTYWTTTDPTPHTDQLPNGIYTWSEPYTLVGSTDHAMIRLQARNNRFVREQLPPPYVFRDQDLSFQQTTSVPETLLLTKSSLQDRVYQLANPTLRLVDRFDNLLILKDISSQNWLALTLTQTPPYAGDAQGDYPRWFKDPLTPNRRRALLIHGGEVWLWEPGQSTTLLWRQAKDMRQAAWDPDGAHVILADAEHVFALDLDDRDGRIVTPLATFQDIRDIALLRNTLYISGTQEERTGVFTLSLE